MSATEENQLLKMVIETQASRIKEQEGTIKELRLMVDELRSLKANLEEVVLILSSFWMVLKECCSVMDTRDSIKLLMYYYFAAALMPEESSMKHFQHRRRKPSNFWISIPHRPSRNLKFLKRIWINTFLLKLELPI